jgi:hypothetical protein
VAAWLRAAPAGLTAAFRSADRRIHLNLPAKHDLSKPRHSSTPHGLATKRCANPRTGRQRAISLPIWSRAASGLSSLPLGLSVIKIAASGCDLAAPVA